MKDPNDASRQKKTVESLLERFFHPNPKKRFEIQILADEVGMGKTFVALGLAYSLLAHLRSRTEPDLAGCYQRVLVLTPGNQALFRKWVREVSEFRRRCVPTDKRFTDIHFVPVEVDRLDDLAVKLRKPGRQPQVIIARMSLFGGDKLINYDLKRRFTMGALFRYWGAAFNYERRERLLRGAPQGWPSHPNGLTELTETEAERLPFTEEEFQNILRRFGDSDQEELESLLAECRDIAEPFFRNRDEHFVRIERKLRDVYRKAALYAVQRDLPLLIVDEAHNWKNGPSSGANGFHDFSRYLAPHIRRALLLTATPFQLRPEEMLEILKVSDFIRPSSDAASSNLRVSRLKMFRENVVQPVLTNAENQSRCFSRAWARLPRRVTPDMLENAWSSEQLAAARKSISSLAELDGAITQCALEVAKVISAAVAGIHPDIRNFMKEALQLFAANRDLSCELGKLVIRHRRETDHRLFLVGSEYGGARKSRADGHILHAAPGLDVAGEAELPQYLLMRCVSEMKGGKGRSSLGQDLTGCYSTLHESSEGRRIKHSLINSVEGRRYFDLLSGMVNRRSDHKHPKLSKVVDEVVRHWQAGEKVLIFCSRINTAERVHDILTERIRRELATGKKKCLGGESQLKALRGRLTGKDRDLITLGLDRVLWSVAWTVGTELPFNPAEFILDDNELRDLARLSLLFNSDVAGERVDRVFLNRATEHLLARRFRLREIAHRPLANLLDRLADEDWVAYPYGFHVDADHEEHSEDGASFDERGCHTKYTGPLFEPLSEDVDSLAAALKATRQRARAQKQIPLLDTYALSPSLWLGSDPQGAWRNTVQGELTSTVRCLHRYLSSLSQLEDLVPGAASDATKGGEDFQTRALVMQALRRAVFRDSVLLRLLPQRADLHESGWGELLATAFFANLPNQHESMAGRINVFLEDLNAASGEVTDPTSARGGLYQATRLRDQQFVALVKGAGGGNTAVTRDRIFNGFNTPLLPEVLVCTSVAQEGIDLHRHCRHVIHYDLAWNPAVLEQRTGRTDRIGSKTFRERATSGTSSVFLEIGVPFLAGTYDERMYEELRIRSQTFEVLTGGEFAADHAVGDDHASETAATKIGASLPLPACLTDDLRVKFQVWTKATGTVMSGITPEQGALKGVSTASESPAASEPERPFVL